MSLKIINVFEVIKYKSNILIYYSIDTKWEYYFSFLKILWDYGLLDWSLNQAKINSNNCHSKSHGYNNTSVLNKAFWWLNRNSKYSRGVFLLIKSNPEGLQVGAE